MKSFAISGLGACRPRRHAEITTQRLESDGMIRWVLTPYGKVAARVVGQGPALLFVPGLWGGSHLAMPLIQELARSYRVHWFDWPGEGASIPGDMARNVFRPEAIFDSVVRSTGENSLTVIAHSFGAWVALRALQGVDKSPVRRLFLLGSGMCHGHRVSNTFLRNLKTVCRFEGLDPFLSAWAKCALGPDSSNQAALRTVVGALCRTVPHTLAARARWLEDAVAAQSLAGQSVPVTLLVGDRDRVEPLHSQVRLADAVASKVVTVPGAGHLATLTHPKDLSRSIARELEQPATAMAARGGESA